MYWMMVNRHLRQKPWTLRCDSAELCARLELRCKHSQRHLLLAGKADCSASAYYSVKMARCIAQLMMREAEERAMLRTGTFLADEAGSLHRQECASTTLDALQSGGSELTE